MLYDSIEDLNSMLFSIFSTDVETNWRQYIRLIRRNREKLQLLIRAHREYFLLDALNELTDYTGGMDFRTVIPHGYIYNITVYWVKCGLPGTDKEVVRRITEACRENALAMLSGEIPQQDAERTRSHKY